MPRPPRPDDLARIRLATDPRLSPDGRLAAFVVETATPNLDGVRHAIWLVPTDGSEPARQVTIGAKHDTHPRFSPDGRSLAFLSDRRTVVEDEPGREKDREDGTQVHLLPLDGGEARRLTDLPRGVDRFEWSPDGRRLVVLSSSAGATREEDARRRGIARRPDPDRRRSDYRYIDRLAYQENDSGFLDGPRPTLWLVEAETGEARRLTEDRDADEAPAWSPDGTRIAFTTNLRRDPDLAFRSSVVVLDVESGTRTRVTDVEDALFFDPAWLPDGRTLAVLGGRYPEGNYRSDVWLFAADGADASPGGGRNLSGRHDVMPDSSVNSDVTRGEPARLIVTGDGHAILFTAPVDGSLELWRLEVGDGALTRLTHGRHLLSAFDAAADRTVVLRSDPTSAPDLFRLDDGGRLTRLTDLNRSLLDELELVEPVERWTEVDGHRIQGWLYPSGPGARPLVTDIHGGPHTLFGWAPFWHWQVLAGAGMSVYASNPRGSEGYGLEFNRANLRDWGPGPMRDVLAGIDRLVEDGLADPDRLGLTGGSYGGYLTNWILARDHRFRAAITCRSVSDMAMLFLTGDISGGDWARSEFGVTPWEDPDYYREISPITRAHEIRTPLLIQHSERDLRTTVGQAEALFTVLRSHRRPVRLMRVPEETHELTRSGTPFRRVENIVQVRDWFAHFLVRGRRGLPPLPRDRAGR